MQEAKIAELEQDTLGRLELQVLFGTGEDQLSRVDRERLEGLSNYLLKNPKLRVKLDGHADRRGTDEYNNVLSRERALAVKAALVESGISDERIQIVAHGSSLSNAAAGDQNGYARDRRVVINLAPTMNQSVTQANR